jgi:sigma-E factor negative regulatory protein RseC
MLVERGRVISVDSDGLWVETLQRSACQQCSAQKGCGQSLVARSVMKNMTLIKARFGQQSKRYADKIWRVGDEIDIGIEENALVLGTLIVYLLPLLLLVLGAILGAQYSDAMSAIFSFAGLMLGALFVRWHSATRAKHSFYHAIVLD